MNTLEFPVRVYEAEDGTVCLMIPHDSSWPGNLIHKDKMDQTRKFCTWIRKHYRDKVSEYRYLNTKRVRNPRVNRWCSSAYRTVNIDKHFCVYGITKDELMLIKLAWLCKWQVAARSHGEGVDFVFKVDPTPSPAYVERQQAKERDARQKKLHAEQVKQQKALTK